MSQATKLAEIGELDSLRARVKELEEIERHLGGRVEDQRSKIRSLEEGMAMATGKAYELTRRIRELEEAMPEVGLLRSSAKSVLAMSLAKDPEAMADRIEKVMNPQPKEN